MRNSKSSLAVSSRASLAAWDCSLLAPLGPCLVRETEIGREGRGWNIEGEVQVQFVKRVPSRRREAWCLGREPVTETLFSYPKEEGFGQVFGRTE